MLLRPQKSDLDKKFFIAFGRHLLILFISETQKNGMQK